MSKSAAMPVSRSGTANSKLPAIPNTAPDDADKPRPHPSEALKRFSETMQESAAGRRFIQINKDRVSDFLNKPSVFQSNLEQIMNDGKKKEPKPIDLDGGRIRMQNLPECQKELGMRSRFGDGDGSFFDLWLNSGGTLTSKQKYDSAGLPIASKVTKKFHQPLVGFKRHYMLQNGDSTVYEHNKYSAIMPYEERRRLRLERERLEKEQQEGELNETAQPIPPTTSATFLTTVNGRSSPSNGRNSPVPSTLAHAGLAVVADILVSRSSIGSRGGSVSPPKPGSRAKGMQRMSTTERDTYFGEEARNSFFGYYRQLARQQHLFTSTSEAGGVEVSSTGISKLLDPRVESTALGGGFGLGGTITKQEKPVRIMADEKRSEIHNHIKDRFGAHLESNTDSQRPLNIEVGDEIIDGVATARFNGSSSSLDLSISFNNPPSTPPTDSPKPTRLETMRRMSRKFGSKSSLMGTSTKMPSARSLQGQHDSDSEEDIANESSPNEVGEQRKARSNRGSRSSTTRRKSSDIEADLRFNELMNDLEIKTQDNMLNVPSITGSTNDIDNAMLAVATRPLSARSRFLISCVSSNIQPDPSLVVRRRLTSELNISSKSIGDKMAQVLASALPTLPMLEILKLADNRLTDSGLTSIIDILCDCPRLTSLDISQNKVDSLGAKSLATFLSHPKCLLVDLILVQADLDDLEAANFINALGVNNTVSYIDMSRNLLGSHELRIERIKNPERLVTGAMALGNYLASPNCSLKTLILSWNMIRLNSCLALVQSLAFNVSLTHLDLSYNGLGLQGGEVLGDSLHTQRSLEYLNIAHNNIQPRAAFVILCGVRSCETLKIVDISENPIGEVGGKALMSLNLAMGDSITVEVRGCSIRSKDSSCWFDPKKPPKDMKLTLSNLYDRAVCIEMLRLIAANEDLKVSKCRFTLDKATGPRELEFVTKKVSRARTASAGGIGGSDPSKQAKGTDVESAQRLFRQYDEDGNGSLDRHELSHLLKGLGLTNSKEAVDQMLAVYDIERSGVIEEAEFIQFLTTMQESAAKAAQQANEKRYLMLKEESMMPPLPSTAPVASFTAPLSGSPTKAGSSSAISRRQSQPALRDAPFLPPNLGMMELSVKLENAASVFMQTATSGNVMTVIQATKALADSSAMIDCALASMNLKFEEAMVLYRIMIKEVGDRSKVLLQLLPRVATPADARRLYNKTSSGDLEEKLTFRALAGKLYDVYMRTPSGYYDFNLADPMDRSLLHRLIDIHKANVHERQKLDYADTSENGDWLCNFRNVILDNQRFRMTDEWLDALPSQGHLHFDFVPLTHTTPNDHAMSDIRFLNLLIGLGLINEDDRGHIHSRLQMLDEQGRMMAKGVGIVNGNEINLNDAEEMMIQFDQIKSRLAERANVVDKVHAEREAERLAYFAKSATIDSARDSVNVSTARGAGGGAAVVPVLAHDHDKDHGIHAVEGVSIDSYADCLRLMNNNPDVSFDLVAAHTFDAILEVIAGRMITMAQLAIIIECFPTMANAPSMATGSGSDTETTPEKATTLRKAVQSTKYHSAKSNINAITNKINKESKLVPSSEYQLFSLFSTMRVELIIMLFPQIVDLVNFDLVFLRVSTAERALLLSRLGILNIWNPLKLDGAYSLDLASYEQRQVLKVLIFMAIVEPGENWVDESFRETRVDSKIEGWELPYTWFVDTCIPHTGIVSLKYFSGNGTGTNNCAPNPMARMLLMCTVHPQPYLHDAHKFQRASLSIVHELNVEFGSSVFFGKSDAKTVLDAAKGTK